MQPDARGSLLTRVSLLVTLTVLMATLISILATWLLVGRVDVGTDRDTVVGVMVTMLVLIVAITLGAVAITHRTMRPLTRMVQATQEMVDGRHPDEALASLPQTAEVRIIADAFRNLTLRLREIDATDRRFLMSISHELRTPLTAIHGHAQLMQDGLADDAASRDQSLAVIQREVGRLERLVEDLMDLARLRSNRFTTVTEVVNLDELGAHLLAVFEDRRSNIDVVGEFESVLLQSDGHRILQILRNLIGNALRYAQTQVVVRGYRDGGSIRVSVFNDGEPIAPDQQKRIFEPFVGTKREGGMGLGLAIGRELAWALGGQLTIVTRDDGAEFELELPLELPELGR